MQLQTAKLSAAADAVADGEAFARDSVSANTIGWVSQADSAAIIVSKNSSLFMTVGKRRMGRN